MHTFQLNFNLGKNKTKPHATSDQEQEPATEHTPVDYAREREGLEESLVHCTTAEGERPQDSEDLINLILDLYSDVPCLLPSSETPVCPESPICPELSVCLAPTSEANI